MYVCFSNVNFINTMIIMKKIIYLVLLALITGLAAQAHEKTGEWNGCDRYDFTFKDRQATIVVPKKAAKGNRSMVFKNRAGFDVIVTQPGAVFYRVALGRKGTKALRGV